MKTTLFFTTLFSLIAFFSFAQDSTFTYVQDKGSLQDSTVIHLIFPDNSNWNVLQEGQKLEFTVKAVVVRVAAGENMAANTASTSNENESGESFSFSITEGKQEGMSFDSLGNFSWTPNYDFVDRLNLTQNVQVVFEVKNNKNQIANKVINFKVSHVNRLPLVGDLKPFYVQHNVLNTYMIDINSVRDEDNDPLVFIPVPDAMPEGAKLSAQGEFTWKPSLTQFNQLKSKPLILEFYVEDQPAKARTKGKFKIEVTQMDLSPEISIVPKTGSIRYNENATINLKFYLSDPNGDTDIATFGFVSENPVVPKSALIQNTANQYEFIWTPGYDFVKDPLDSLTFNLNFFVIDKSQKRDEEKITVTIFNTINEEEKDRKLYTEYRTSLVKAWDLLEQLKDTEKDLKKKFNRARKGKKGRSIANASLGAVSGIAPVVIEPSPTQKIVSTIGGTTVMTLGTLEATEVIGRSTKDLLDRINYVMEKKYEIQTKGDIFARKYALRSLRRKPEFIKDLDDFVASMNLKGLVALELDAGWQNKNKATDTQLTKTFKDFNPDN
jgi:hypothetical protein